MTTDKYVGCDLMASVGCDGDEMGYYTGSRILHALLIHTMDAMAQGLKEFLRHNNNLFDQAQHVRGLAGLLHVVLNLPIATIVLWTSSTWDPKCTVHDHICGRENYSGSEISFGTRC